MDLNKIETLVEKLEKTNLIKFRYISLNEELSFEKMEQNKKSNDVHEEQISNTNRDISEIIIQEPTGTSDKNIVIVKANFVGIIKLDEKIKQGKKDVQSGQTLCVIEAMKIYNDICCPVDGEIVDILIDDETLVDYDQELFKIRGNSYE